MSKQIDVTWWTTSKGDRKWKFEHADGLLVWVNISQDDLYDKHRQENLRYMVSRSGIEAEWLNGLLDSLHPFNERGRGYILENALGNMVSIIVKDIL